MNTLKYSVVLLVFFSTYISCGKCPEECASGEIKILGGCTPGLQNAYIFGGFPNFHCFNDSIVLFLNTNLDVTLKGNSFYFLNKANGLGSFGIGPTTEESWYDLDCKNNNSEFKDVVNFMHIKNFDLINSQSQNLNCVFYNVKEYVLPTNDKVIIPKDLILDSLEYTMTRLN